MAVTRISEEVIEVRAEGVAETEAQFGRVAESLGNIESATRRGGKGAEDAGRKMRRFSAVLRDVHNAAHVLKMGLQGIKQAMAGLAAPVKMASGFGSGFAQMTTLLDGSRAELVSYRDEIKALASSLPQSADEVTAAGYRLISSGTSKSEVAERMQAVSRLAVAAKTDLQTAAKALQLGVNKYGAGVQEASDALFTLVKMGDLDGGLSDAITALARAGDVTGLGVKLDEVAGALQLMTINGKDAGTAATQLLSVVKVLSNESSDAAKALKANGVETGVAAIQAKGLAGVLADVQRVTGGSTEAINGLTNDFEATRGLLALLGDNFGGLTRHIEAQGEAAGATAEAHDKMADTTAFALQRFSSLRDDVLIDLGDRILPHVNELLERLSAALREHGDDMAEAVGAAADALAVVGEFLLAHGGKIAAIVGTMFAAKTVRSFTGAIDGALGELKRFEVSAVGRFGRVGGLLQRALTSVPVLGAIAGAGVALADTLIEHFNGGVRARLEASERELEEWTQRVEELARRAGFSTEAGRQKARGEILSGARFGWERHLLAEDSAAGVDLEDRTPAEELAHLQRQLQLTEQMTSAEARAQAIAEVRARLDEERATRLAEAVGLEEQAFRLRQRASDYVEQRQAELQRGGARAAAARTQAVDEASAMGLGFGAPSRESAERAAALTSEAREIRLAVLRLGHATSVAIQDAEMAGVRPALAGTFRRPGKPGPKGPSLGDMQRSLDETQARRLQDLAIASIEDPLERALAKIEAKVSREAAQAAAKGLDPGRVRQVGSAEKTAARVAHGERTRREQAAADARISEERESAARALVERLHDGELEALDRQHAEELARYEAHGLAVAELTARQADERRAIVEKAAKVAADAQEEQFRRVTGDVQSVGASLAELASVVGAASSVVGVFESLGLAASVTYHGAQVFSEGAKAATAFAGGLIPVGMAHVAAQASHAAAAVKSGAALAEIGRAGGGAAPVASVTQPRTPSRAESARVSQERASPSVQIGDIVLGRMVYIHGVDARRRFADGIARDIGAAINRNAARRGGQRLGRHAVR